MRVCALLAVAAAVLVGAGLDTPHARGLTPIVVNKAIEGVDPNDGVCTFREALIAANTNAVSGPVAGECAAGAPGMDVIEFSDTGAIPIIGSPLPSIVEDLEIMDASGVTLDAGGFHRVLHVDGSSVTFVDLRLIRGVESGDGGAVLVENAGALTLKGGSIEDSSSQAGDGGAIAVDGSSNLTLDNVVIDANDSRSGAIAILDAGSTADLIDSRITNNTSTGASRGSAIYTAGAVTVTGSTISDNLSLFGGATVWVEASGSVQITRTTIANNTAGGSGAPIIRALGAVDVDRSAIGLNQTSGHVVFVSGSLELLNSSISNNQTGTFGTSAVSLTGSGSLDMFFSTIAHNSGIGVTLSLTSQATIGASLVVDNSVQLGTDVFASTGFSGSFTSQGYNVVGNAVDSSPGGLASFAGPGDLTGVTNAAVANLANNGGSTLTNQLGLGSPALDHVTGIVTGNPSIDQRGTSRPQGAAKDAGAFEASGVLPRICDGLVATIDMNINGGIGLGTAGPDVIVGTPGADSINAAAGDDTICGGTGDDVIRAGSGVDTVFGEGGADTIRAGGGGDDIDGGANGDEIFGQGGIDTIHGGAGDDTINGQGARDQIYGDDGDDTLNGQNGADGIWGGLGGDTLRGNTGPDTLRGEDGDDQIFGGDGGDFLYGGDGVDTCSGNTGPDSAQSATCEATPGVESFF